MLRRTRVLAVVVVLATLGSLLHVAGGQATSQRLQQTQQELVDARRKLDTLRGAVHDAGAQLQAVDAHLAALASHLAALEAELASAETALQQAADHTAQLTGQLQEETERLHEAEARLDEQNHLFDARVANAYKHGAISYTHTLVAARTFTEFLNGVYYIRSVLDYDKSIVDERQQLVLEVTEGRAEISRLRDEALEQEAVAAAARDHVAQLTKEQRLVTEEARAERLQRRTLLANLQHDQRQHEQLVTDLQRESERLAEELRRSRWRAGAPGKGELAWPTDGTVGSPYGWRTHPIFGTRRFHAGVDIGNRHGGQVVAAAEGLVVFSGWRGGYGLTVVIDHGGGLATLYAHLSAARVREGQVVSKAQRIGDIGCTGWCTGPHLHYEVRQNGEPRNPMNWY